MADARKTAPPPGFVEIERALHLLDMGETSRWVASRLRNVATPAAQEAAALLRAKERAAAKQVLEAELLRLAGPPSGEQLAWFHAEVGQARDERKRPW
jgi:hypothetical protein